jgi:hypothetical protein
MEEPVLKCRNCGADNPNDAELCAKCGSTLPTVAGARALIPDGSYEAFPEAVPLVVGVLGFLMIVAAAWEIGGTLGAAVFFAALGATMMVVAFVYSIVAGKR